MPKDFTTKDADYKIFDREREHLARRLSEAINAVVRATDAKLELLTLLSSLFRAKASEQDVRAPGCENFIWLYELKVEFMLIFS